MTEQLSGSAQRVQDALDKFELALEVRELTASTRTAQDAADAVGCDVGQIVKSLIFKGKQSEKPILVLVSGSNRVNEKALGRIVGEKISKPNAAFVREQTGFAIGGVAPVGHTQPLDTYIDQDLLTHPHIWAAAGTHNALFKLPSDQLERITGGKIINVS